MKRIAFIALILAATIAGTIIVFWDKIKKLFPSPTPTAQPPQTIVLASAETKTELQFASITRKEVTTPGVINSGKIFVKISNIGENEGTITIGGITTELDAGSEWQFPQSTLSVLKKTYEIPYDATDTIFLIETLNE